MRYIRNKGNAHLDMIDQQILTLALRLQEKRRGRNEERAALIAMNNKKRRRYI
jgi:hypothetical protein